MNSEQLRTEARLVLFLPVADDEVVDHILARLWSAGSPQSRALHRRYCDLADAADRKAA